MNEFFVLLAKISPLYVIVFLGYVAGKKFRVDRDSVSTLLIYFIAPVVVFNGVASAPSEQKYLFLPLLTFVLACAISLIFYIAAGKSFKGSERGLIGFMSGTGNTGYFGLPVILALFGTRLQSIAILATLGFVLFENTLGYYYIARQGLTAKQAMTKVLKLPAVYAYALGVVANIIGYHPPTSVADNILYFRGAYVILGMIIIGIGLASVTKASVDRELLKIAFAAKFVAFPVAMICLKILNTKLGYYSNDVMSVLVTLSAVPLASNTVSFASQLKVHPEKAAFTVLLSTIFALVYLPIIVAIFVK
jgi:malate permease and related proteins